ncbi:hypothetical protein BDY24DRAFT_346075, partial [Mrakia frigida]|uniref:uncharacterized protein n=1 Tax=Mrakia frigida TaxID=29902 RepID=UPI003FCBFD71
FGDDMSGNRTKRWNEHFSFYLSNASLPRWVQEIEGNIHFVGTSKDASPLEMGEGVVALFSKTFEKPLRVWDSKLRRDVLVVPFPVVKLGDNPMLAEEASSMSLNSNGPCRICTVNIDQAGKKTAEGFASYLVPSDPRRLSTTLSHIASQIRFASLGRWTDIDPHRTKFGVKDTVSMDHCLALAAFRLSLLEKGEVGDLEVEKIMQEKLEEVMRGTWHSPWLTMEGFDIHGQSPVEVLHSFALGPVKYLWRNTLALTTNNPVLRQHLRCALASIETEGFGTGGGNIQADYFMKHGGSLIGKDLKTLVQILPVVLLPLVKMGLVPRRLFEAWKALGVLSTYIYQSSVPEEGLKLYLVSLRRLGGSQRNEN